VTETSDDDGSARGIVWILFLFDHIWVSVLRAPSSTDVSVLLLNKPIYILRPATSVCALPTDRSFLTIPVTTIVYSVHQSCSKSFRRPFLLHSPLKNNTPYLKNDLDIYLLSRTCKRSIFLYTLYICKYYSFDLLFLD